MQEKKETARRWLYIALSAIGLLMLIGGGLVYEFTQSAGWLSVMALLCAVAGLLCFSVSMEHYGELRQTQHALVQVVDKVGEDGPRNQLEGRIVFRPVDGGKDIRLWVSQEVYARIHAGDEGTLRYRGGQFLSFGNGWLSEGHAHQQASAKTREGE